jgi:O-antigen ligase
VLAACALIMPALAVYAPLGLAPLLAVSAVLLLLAQGRSLARPRDVAPLTGLLVLLSLWATLSATWSILPQHSLFEGLRLLLLSAGGLILLGAARALDAPQRATLGIAVAIGVALAVVLLLVEGLSDGALLGAVLRQPVRMTHFDRGSTVLVLSLWAALIALGRHRVWALLLAAAAVVAVLLLPSAAATLALGVSVAVFLVAWRWPRLVALAMAAVALFLALALPPLLPSDRGVVAIHQAAPWIKYSGIHRLMIWRFTADRIAERPFLGWGMDASRELPGSHRDLAELYPQAGIMPDAEALPLHPHNAALQWRVELGWPGALLCVAIVGWIVWRVARAPALSAPYRAGALAWIAAALVIGMLSYGAWQAWWLSCLWLMAALYAGLADPATSDA